jgi:hypothetical protein
MNGGLAAVGTIILVVWYLGRRCCPTVATPVTGTSPDDSSGISPKELFTGTNRSNPVTPPPGAAKASGLKPSVLAPRNQAPGQAKGGGGGAAVEDPLSDFANWLGGGAHWLFGGGAKQDIQKDLNLPKIDVPGLSEETEAVNYARFGMPRR